MEWFDDENFWRDMYSLMFPESKFEKAKEEVEKVLILTDFKGKNILDLCCGPGRHAIELAKKGFNVTGVDCTPFLLDKARKRAISEKLEIEWVLEDMRDFLREDSYGLIINMFTSFGYFDNKDEDIRVLNNVYKSLKKNGILLLEIMGKEILARIFKPVIITEHPDGSLLIQRHKIFDNWSRIRNEWILIKDEKAKSYKFHHTIYSAQELKDHLLQVGFKNVGLYGNLDGNDYGTDASRLTAVAQK